MSAQGGTLARRGAVHLPIWPVAALLVAAVAAAIGMSILTRSEVRRPVAVVTDEERLANSSAAIREQGAVGTAVGTTRPLSGYQAWHAEMAGSTYAVGLENPSAYGISQVTEATSPVGLENPGAYGISQVTEATYPVGLENPGAYPGDGQAESTGAAPHRSIEVNGRVCGQCR